MKEQHSHPESQMMSYGYQPQLSQGAVKCPIFMTSTFAFNSAEEGKAFFEIAYGKRIKEAREEMGLIYSRINNPDLEILEDRLTLWDEADAAVMFNSGMSAIATVMMEFLRPGDLLVHSRPLYGGTHHFLYHVLSKWGIHCIGFDADESADAIAARIIDSEMSHRLAMVFVETPANPTNTMVDIAMCKGIAEQFARGDRHPLLVVDNTYMGPVWQQPLKHGADIVLYSATKYLGGHSDLIAGAVLGNALLMQRVKTLRTFLGNMCSPHTGWLLMRSLETLKLRMDKQADNAIKVAEYLHGHPLVEQLHFPRYFTGRQAAIWRKQCNMPGAMISFAIKGGEAEAFQWLNALKLIKLAVSLGSTESLAEHPATMTHADVPDAEKAAMGIGHNLIRLSIGVEHPDDIIADLERAFRAVHHAGHHMLTHP